MRTPQREVAQRNFATGSHSDTGTVLPVLMPVLHRTHPDLCLDLLETQTETLVSELAQGTLDVLLLALPLEKSPFETVVLFTDHPHW
jgi:DNA-binding transcriptional LysR family regulator